MNARVLPAVASLVALLAGCAPRAAEESASAITPAAEPVTELTIADAWCRPTPPGATAGAMYMAITSPAADSLVGVRVSDRVAARAEVHEVVDEGGGRMGMRAATAVGVTAGQTLELRPGSYHIMLQELRRPLAEGDTVVATLSFQRAGERAVAAIVRRP